jgi:hypothetical protein
MLSSARVSLIPMDLLESDDFAAQSTNPRMKCGCLLALVDKPPTSIVSDAIIAKSVKRKLLLRGQ